MLKPTNGFTFEKISGSSSGSGGSHPLKYRSSECFEFDGEDIGLENCPTSMSLPNNSIEFSDPLHVGVKAKNDTIASSLPPPSVLRKRASHIPLPLEMMVKPVDPVTEETPSTPIAAPPAKPKWQPSRKKAKPPEEPTHPTWDTSSNKKYNTYLEYTSATAEYRKTVQTKGNNVARMLQESGGTRQVSVLRNVKRLQQDPEQAELNLNRALNAARFTNPPTVESLQGEGVCLRSLSALKGKYWYSIHTPLNMLKMYSLFMCSETDRSREVHITKHYLMKVAKRVALDHRSWEGLYLDLEMLRKVSHENCVSLVEAMQTETDVHMVLAPFMECDVVTAAGKGLGGAAVQKIIRGAAKGLQYLHEEMGVAYCGLRGCDVLFDGEHARLSDFSHVRCVAQDSPVSFSFKRISRKHLESTHLITQDVISLGCLLHLLYYGSVPLHLIQDLKSAPTTPDPLPSLLKGSSSLYDFLGSPWLARSPPEDPSFVVADLRDWVKEVRNDADSLIKLLFTSSLLDRA
eukprot:TRINITY_DN25484_c0_g1_i1.p1 TRINITY_DN25484_c0_g1~~TRINITY_DN25484_c0_g1_i1.p1  ORF type:complete len:538 (+),score=141.41 TRINITY_DN25484_c0_g1_i1:65-1615(+)